MFDLEVFVGPAVVLLGMFVGLLGFAIWGTRAIRESAPLPAQMPNVAPLVDGVGDFDSETAAPLTEIELPGLEGSASADLLEGESAAGVNLEKTAEFEQPLTSVNTVASFSQSFWEGQEVATPNQSDYNEAIERIQADLDAADAEEFNKNAGDALAAADVLEALRHGVVNNSPASDNAPENIEQTVKIAAEEVQKALEQAGETSAQTASAEQSEDMAEDTDNEATRLISSQEAAAILADEQESQPAESDLPVPESAVAESIVKDLAVDNVAANELAGNMEETVVMKKLPLDEPPTEDTFTPPAAPKPAAPPAPAPMPSSEPPAPNLQRMPPGVANSFGFINNQANGMASAVGMTPRILPDLSHLTQEEAGDTPLPESPLPFGPKMAWLAIPGFKPSEVITALRLDDVQTANWTQGLQAAYADNNQVFVSPSLGGWVLVIGKTLWERADMNRSAENISWLKEICRKFGNACFFSTMRGLGNHGWVGIRDGQIFRAYGYSGELQELIWLVGEPTEEEIAINPGFITEVREKYQPGFRPIIPDEKLVLSVAAAWSIDPGFRRRQYPADFGMVGYMN